ncbi:MAG: hypothetical protein O7B98_07560 [Alphaproteobacteria bacterium]|nr:hypothetical protein [Alphaproteobacteria bacterium]
MPWKVRVLKEGATGEGATLWRFEPWLFVALAVITVAPIWTISVFPTVDGPAHVAITHIWLAMDRPEGAHFRDHFVENLSLFPNWFCYAVLAVLMKFLSPFVAERVLVTLFGLSLAVTARFALGAIDQRAKPAAYLVLPLAFNYILSFGFYNFSFGVVGFLLCFGIFVRTDGLRSGHGMAMFVPALVLTGLTHLSAVALTGLSLGVYAIGLFLLDMTSSRKVAIGRLWSRGSRLLIASLPGLVPSLLLLTGMTGAGEAASETPSLTVENLKPYYRRIVALGYVVVWYTSDLASSFRVILAVAFAISCHFAWRFSRLGWSHPVVLVFCFLLTFFLLTPDQIVVRWVPQRVLVYLYVALVLLAGAALAMARDAVLFRRFRMFLVGIGCLLVVLATTLNTMKLGDLDADFAELLSGAESVAPRSTVLLLRIIGPVDDATALEAEHLAIQAGGYYTALRNTIDVRLAQATTNTVPIKFVRGHSIFEAWISNLELSAGLPMPDFGSFERVMGYPLDYVIVWGRLDQIEDNRKQAFLRRLTPYYRQVFRSRETGRLRVFQRNGMAGEP